MQKLIDIGANLTNKQFRSDFHETLARSKGAGVGHIILTGTNGRTSEESSRLAKADPEFLSSTAGVHPHDAKSWNADLDRMVRRLCEETHVVAVGECGLDYNRNFSPQDQQRDCFEAQLQIAQESQKPVFLHERDAHEDFLRILKKYIDGLSNTVVHCFTGNQESLFAYLDLGCHIGITGWVCDSRRGGELRELTKVIPADRLMIETDAPFLKPHHPALSKSGRRNEPAYLVYVLETVAALRNISKEELAEQLCQTTTGFFDVDPRQ